MVCDFFCRRAVRSFEGTVAMHRTSMKMELLPSDVDIRLINSICCVVSLLLIVPRLMADVIVEN